MPPERRIDQPLDGCGGVVLCGGASRRMGRAKADLPFGPESMLARVVRILADLVRPIAVVAAQGQSLPSLPGGVRVVRDRRGGRGPLEGLAVGLAAVRDAVPAAFVTSCDVPLLRPAFVGRIVSLLGDDDVAVPRVDNYHHPLSAVYRTSVVPHIERLLVADRLRPVYLFDAVSTRIVLEEELRGADPQLDSLKNINRPEDYLAALELAGLVPSEEVLRQLGLDNGARQDKAP